MLLRLIISAAKGKVDSVLKMLFQTIKSWQAAFLKSEQIEI